VHAKAEFSRAIRTQDGIKQPHNPNHLSTRRDKSTPTPHRKATQAAKTQDAKSSHRYIHPGDGFANGGRIARISDANVQTKNTKGKKANKETSRRFTF
jgi:hypothetical protein